MSAPFSLAGVQPAPLGKFSYRKSVVLPFPELSKGHRRQSDRAVVTWVAGSSARKCFSITGPAMKRYADRTGADFVVLDGYCGQPYALSNKFRVRQVFDEYGYNVILFVDADALIRDHCVNFFDLVPPDHVGILDETPHHDEWTLANYRREASALLLSQGYRVTYRDIPSPKNSGLYIMPSSASAALSPLQKPFPICSRNGATVEQTWLSLMLHKQQLQLYNLIHPQEHWMWYADQKEQYANDAMVLHFAGLEDERDRRFKRLIHYASQPCASSCIVNPGDSPEIASANSFDRQMMLNHGALPVLRMLNAHIIDTHRYGWKVALNSLSVLTDLDGVIFDGFIESTFLYHARESLEAGIAPYREPWMGFIHNPPAVPDWPSITEGRLQNLRRNRAWLDSLPYCLGVFALSEYLARWIRSEWKIPCETLRYPTLTPYALFSMDKYAVESKRIVATVGFWLRRFSSFSRLKAPGFRKIRPLIMPITNVKGIGRVRAYEEEESKSCNIPSKDTQSVEIVDRLSGSMYDDLLSKAVVFLHLIDASAVTTIVECLVRGTPLLINRIPAVVEYLGNDYPFYFDSLEEAESKLQDTALVEATHRHMRQNSIVNLLTPQAFLNCFANTRAYRRALALCSMKNRLVSERSDSLHGLERARFTLLRPTPSHATTT